MVAVSVTDRGVGIDPLEQGMIFEKFYRGRQFRGQSTRSRVAGTGMGLAISKAIVSAHGGEITVTSQPERETVFTLTVPAATNPIEAQAGQMVSRAAE